MGMLRNEISLTTFSVDPLITNLVEIGPVVSKVKRVDGQTRPPVIHKLYALTLVQRTHKKSVGMRYGDLECRGSGLPRCQSSKNFISCQKRPTDYLVKL
jgi:hypothetical protein